MLKHTTRIKEWVVEEGIVGTPEDRDFLRLPCLIPSSHKPNENRGVHIDDKGPLIFFRRQSVIIWEQVLMRNVVDVFLHANKTVEYIPRKEYWLDRQLTTQLQSSLFCVTVQLRDARFRRCLDDRQVGIGFQHRLTAQHGTKMPKASYILQQQDNEAGAALESGYNKDPNNVLYFNQRCSLCASIPGKLMNGF